MRRGVKARMGFGLALFATLAAAGCVSLDLSQDGERPSPVASGSRSATGTASATGTSAGRAGGVPDAASAELVLSVDNSMVSILRDAEVRIEATFRDAQGRPTLPGSLSWRATLAPGSDGPVATGTEVPATLTLRLPGPGAYRLAVVLSAEGFAAATAVLDLVGVPPPECQDRGQPRPATVAPTIRSPVELGYGLGEPGLAVSPEGAIVVTATDRLYRSLDGGQTFEDLGDQRAQGHSDGDLAFDASGTLHWIGLSLDPTLSEGQVLHQRSADRATTFTRPFDVSDGLGTDRPWLDARPNGTLYVAWRDQQGVVTRTSFDGGETWRPRRVLAEEQPIGPIAHGPVPGHVYQTVFPFRSSVGGTQEILLARSLDDGAHWDLRTAVTFREGAAGPQNVANSPSIFPVPAVDAGCTIYVVFSIDRESLAVALPEPAARFGVFMVVSNDFGETWSLPVLLSDPTRVAVMPWIAAGAAGRVAVAWYENTLGLPHETVPDEWHVKMWLSAAADRPSPSGTTVQLTTTPNHLGTICPGGGACVAGGDRSLLDFFEVAIGPDGLPLATWASSQLGTGIGLSPQGTHIWFGGLASGSSLL